MGHVVVVVMVGSKVGWSCVLRDEQRISKEFLLPAVCLARCLPRI